MAFVCTGAYIEGHDTFGMEILAAPVVYGEPVYYSYTIVDADSAATALADLRGASFAFTDPISNTGTLVPTYLLGQLGETPDTFFREYIYTYSHDRSIEAVADGLVDGAAVDSLIYDYLVRKEPLLGKKVRILARSEPYGIPPVVVRPGIPRQLRDRLRNVLLTMHEDPEGALILQGMMLRRFVPANDAAYGTIRAMRDFVKSRTKR
jgi:phosphonate transport system substrate-binding protein